MIKLNRYLFFRILAIALFMLVILICIFILIDFSENSDDFTDRGAELSQIWGEYYVHYIPEMTRLVLPVAMFVACLLLTGQMTERLGITAIKASGISLSRLAVPFLMLGVTLAAVVSYLADYVITYSTMNYIK